MVSDLLKTRLIMSISGHYSGGITTGKRTTLEVCSSGLVG